MRAPDVVSQPAEPVEVLDRRAAVELPAVLLLLDRLGEMRVQRQPEASGERGRLLHQPSGDGERRARRDRDLHSSARPGLVERAASRSVSASTVSSSSTSSSGGSPPSETPRSIEPREATIRTPSSRAASHLRLDQAVTTAREDVVVVEDRRAAGERELGEPGPGGRVLRLGVDAGPDRIQLAEPA